MECCIVVIILPQSNIYYFHLVQETEKGIFIECVILFLYCLIYQEIISTGMGLEETI